MIMGLSVNRLESGAFLGTEEPEVIDTTLWQNHLAAGQIHRLPARAVRHAQ